MLALDISKELHPCVLPIPYHIISYQQGTASMISAWMHGMRPGQVRGGRYHKDGGGLGGGKYLYFYIIGEG